MQKEWWEIKWSRSGREYDDEITRQQRRTRQTKQRKQTQQINAEGSTPEAASNMHTPYISPREKVPGPLQSWSRWTLNAAK